MPNVEISQSEFTELPPVEAVLEFASTLVSEWDVSRFQHFWAGLDQELPEALRRLQHPIDQILGFRALPQNWDSYGSRPIDDRATACSLVLLIQAELHEAHAPFVSPVPGGGVQLEWQFGRRALEFEALPDGSAQFLRVDGETMSEGPLDPSDQTQVRTHIQWLFAKR